MIEAALRQTPQQEVFLDELLAQGVAGLFFAETQYRKTTASCPESLLRELKHHRQIAAFEESIKSRELARVIGLLQQAAVEPILIKGEALAHTCYAEPALRTRQDTDIFISMDDIQITRQVLIHAGYQVSSAMLKSHQFTAWQEDAKGGLCQVLDVHWRISNCARYARIWHYTECRQSALSIDLHGQSALALDRVHSLVLACVHRLGNPGHDPDRLIWLYDIYLLLRRMTEHDLQEFVQLAAASGVASECLDGMRSMSARLVVSEPDEVISALATATAPKGAKHKLSHSQMGLILTDLWQLPGLPLKLQLIRELLLPDAVVMKQTYAGKNDTWLPLLHVQRWTGGLSRWLSLK